MRCIIVIAVLISVLAVGSGITTGHEAKRVGIFVADAIPLEVLLTINTLFEAGDYVWTDDPENAQLSIDFGDPGNDAGSRWVYVPVVPFASTEEAIRWADVRLYWHGDLGALSYLTPDGTPPVFVASQETLRAMTTLLGPPSDFVPLHLVGRSGAIASGLWEKRPYSWGIVGFSDLTSNLKTLTLDGMDIFDRELNISEYTSTAGLELSGDADSLAQALKDLAALGSWPITNRDPNSLSSIILTGVTAMTRGTAARMEEIGITTPARGIKPFFERGDLLHTSNEVSFSERCPPPSQYDGVVFCSNDSYMELLTYIGLDVVELTGNHLNDYGPGAFRHSLEMYAANDIATFGGGHTPEQARQAYVTELFGTTVAFIGCNVAGPVSVWALDYREGAARCDETYLEEEIPRLATSVDIVILTFQEFEYAMYTVHPRQLERFRKYAALGADVIIGSQAHQPHGFGFDSGAFLHHGLGNLFFDQMKNLGTRQMFADKLIIYDGHLLNVVLFTGLIENACCPRTMTAPERANFLTTIFEASGW